MPYQSDRLDKGRYGKAPSFMSFALHEKFKTLAERVAAMPRALEKRADDLNEKMAKVEARGNAVFTGHEKVLAELEKGVSAAEDALNQLTNGVPLP